MNLKENARRILEFDRPAYMVDQPPDYVLRYYGDRHENLEGPPKSDELGARWHDIWKVGFHRGKADILAYPEDHPLADLPKALKTYTFPDPDDERICGQIYRMKEEWDGSPDVYLGGNSSNTLWERAYYLVGMENMMVYMLTEPEAVRELFHKIKEFNMKVARHFVEAGIEIVYFSDDLGLQNGLLFSKDLFLEFILPEYRKLFGYYKEHGVLISYHSCGHIEPLLPELIELGVDMMNPIQPNANDIHKVREITMNHIALQGLAHLPTLCAMTPDEVRRYVARLIWDMGRDGGFFCRFTGVAGDVMPPENQAAYDQTLAEYGRYPLVPPKEWEAGWGEA